MGFSIKVAPGVRIRASSRGVRTSLGPRAARIHIGAGRAGLSTGVGPVSYYTSVGARRGRAHSTGSTNRRLADTGRRTPSLDKAVEAQRLQKVFEAIADIHRESFPDARPPVADPPPSPPLAQFRDFYRTAARRSTSVFDRSARRTALAEADQLVRSEVEGMVADLARQQERQQAALSQQWEQLVRCAPEEVLQTLVVAFADNEAAAAPLAVDGTEVSLVVVVPSLSTVPDRRPGVTQSGNVSLKKMTKTEAAKTYKQLVFGHVLVTLREAFAVAPGLQSARVVALRASADATNGRPEAVLAARCSKEVLATIPWSHVDAVEAAARSLTETVFIEKGVTRALQPIPADKHPDIERVLHVVEFSEG